MANFNHFDFMNNRRASVEPTEVDLKTFNLFMCQMVLSMDKRFVEHLNKINTKEFFDLPKNIQCLAFTSFDGVALDTLWKKSKAGTTDVHKENIEKIMKVYKLSRNEAASCLKYKTVDLDELDELYTRIYEPETIKFKRKKADDTGRNRKKTK